MRNEQALLDDAGLRPTRQRLAILRSVPGEGRPVTAQDLYARLRHQKRSPGLATVYRTLRSLADAGVLRTFPAGESELAYRRCEPGHHHHLICERCGRVLEIPSCEVEEWAAAVAARRGFTASRHQADIFGLCAECQATTRRSRSPAAAAG
jgi:Fur family ferric uptake transcriptional regulator